MKNKFMITAAVVALTVVGGYLGKATTSQADGLSDLELANAEALASSNEEISGHGCVKAAYEWDNDWYEDSKYFFKCRPDCPEQEGTKPKYIAC